MNTEEIVELSRRHVMPTYTQGLFLVRGRGARVWDAEGNEYLDLLAGIAVNSVGHAHPRILKAIRSQSKRLMHTSNLFYNEWQPQLAARLNGHSLGGKCFFCNSGAEANEGLIKLARLWGSQHGGKWRVVTMKNSFHGRTLATLTATGQEKVQKGFEPLPDGFDYAEFNNLESVRARITETTAAVLVEPVQGEGGVIPATVEFMRGLRALCDEKGILLMCDEVQTGLGRTGHWFGYQKSGIQPDAFSLAKGLGGGFPIGAVVASPRLADVFQPGNHGSTFGGTPLACATACAVLDVMDEEHLVLNAEKAGTQFMDGLRKLQKKFSFITDVRGAGLMIGLALDRPAKEMETVLRKHGVIALATAQTVIRFLPALNISAAQIRKALRRIRAACRELATVASQ